jgi:predicted small lipoprotein YifL
MKKKIRAVFAGLMLFSLTACGYDGSYRYPCQDPANWEKAECNPPVCEASGTCTKDLIGSSTVELPTVDGTTADVVTEGETNG